MESSILFSESEVPVKCNWKFWAEQFNPMIKNNKNSVEGFKCNEIFNKSNANI